MMTTTTTPVVPDAIYHEKQFGSLCGQHCLNNLLQGPYFSAENLAGIASELNAAEHALLGSDPRGSGFKSYNVDDSGNFSIQVLRQALQRSHGILLVGGDSVNEAVEAEQAFVLNLHSHWFVIRKLEGEFWTINSMRPKPERISGFYLNAYMSQLRTEGWYIFSVRGNLPTPMKFDGSGILANWYFPKADIEEVSKGTPSGFVPFSGAGHKLNEGIAQPDYDQELHAALQMSLRDQTDASGTAAAPITFEDDLGDADLAKAIAMSMETAFPPQGLLPEPDSKETQPWATIQVVLKSGKRLRRRFLCESLCDQIFLFAQENGEQGDFALISPGTLKERLLVGSGKTLHDVGLVSSSSLRVQALR